MLTDVLAALIVSCAPNVHPHTMSEIVRVESRGNELAINVNRVKRQPRKASNRDEAIATARRYIAMGYSVDMGLSQINSRNLAALGMSVEEAFEPCANLKAGARIISDAFTGTSRMPGGEQEALQRALSAYNTGSYSRGFLNGYVARYYARSSGKPLPPPVLQPVSMEGANQDEQDGYLSQVAEILASN